MTTLDAPAMDLLALLNKRSLGIRDGRINPLAIVDLKEAGFIRINTEDWTVSLTNQGKVALREEA